jgi:hypothetical protein
MLCPATGMKPKWWAYLMKFNSIHYKGHNDKAVLRLTMQGLFFSRLETLVDSNIISIPSFKLV